MGYSLTDAHEPSDMPDAASLDDSKMIPAPDAQRVADAAVAYVKAERLYAGSLGPYQKTVSLLRERDVAQAWLFQKVDELEGA
jgi:hypothetical protein